MIDRDRWRRRWRRWFGYPLQALVLAALFCIFRALPVAAASWLGGRLARAVGPLMPAARIARRNLERSLPALSPAERRTAITGMWDNLGRVLAEYPHLERLWAANEARVELVGAEMFDLIRTAGRPTIMISAHLANWELLAVGAARHGLELTTIYRRPNNPYVDRLIRRVRGVAAERMVAKGRRGGVAIAQALAHGGAVGILVDQKLNDGIPVPFFGRPAMTTPAPAQLALHYNCLVIPVRVERLGESARFRITLAPPLPLPASGDRAADVRALTWSVTSLIETWIREQPAQWLWLHRRWADWT